MKQIPNAFTLLNLIFGCLAVVFILQGGILIANSPEGSQTIEIPEKIWYASLCIGLASVADFADGLLARLLKVSSPIGKELDSLSDVVSFGVAPGMILFQFLRLSLMNQEDGVDAPLIYALPAFLIPCASAWRLARFNLDPSQQTGFKGVPTPAMGLLVASLPLIYWTTDSQTIADLLLNKWFLYGIILVLSAAMVSRIPLMALKFQDFSFRHNLPAILLLILSATAGLFLKWLAVPVIFILYVVLSLAFKNQKA